jgi:NAD(P)-dependent dehydrogenase (short-subunit alcohol dehydrogenase family)
MLLKDTCAIVTGAARGVAKGVASAYVKAGASVVIVDREAELGQATAAELGAIGPVHFIAVDLADRAALPGIVDAAVARFGRLDTLVNAAQASAQVPLLETSTEAMDLAFNTGFWPTFLLMKAAFPHLVESGGSVINFGSGAGIQGMPTQASYGAAKEAIRSLSKTAAIEWGPQSVRVNVICPFALSPGVEAWRDQFPKAYAGQIAGVPLRRIGDPEGDIGGAAVFLASNLARYVTGQTLMVDGGQLRVF